LTNFTFNLTKCNLLNPHVLPIKRNLSTRSLKVSLLAGVSWSVQLKYANVPYVFTSR